MRKNKKNKNKGTKAMAEEKKEEKEVKDEVATKEDLAGDEEKEKEEEDTTLSEIDELNNHVKELEETILKMKEDELRRAADTENYKKRLRSEKENAVKFANESLISDLLEPLDNFSRAIEASEKTDDIEALKKGVVMVKDHLFQVLKQNWGLEMINSKVGTPYDPNTMEAYGVQEKEGIKEEEVAAECATGWLLHGKVLRTAKVFVAKPKK